MTTDKQGQAMNRKYWQCPFEKFEQMRQIDVSQFVKSTNQQGQKKLTYLSREAARHLLMQHFPALCVEFAELVVNEGSGCILKCWLYDNESGLKSETMHYAVQVQGFSRHTAITAPDARQITDSMVRAEVKLIAYMTGIGWSLYSDEYGVDFDNTPDTQMQNAGMQPQQQWQPSQQQWQPPVPQQQAPQMVQPPMPMQVPSNDQLMQQWGQVQAPMTPPPMQPNFQSPRGQ